jgi:putative membrane protein
MGAVIRARRYFSLQTFLRATPWPRFRRFPGKSMRIEPGVDVGSVGVVASLLISWALLAVAFAVTSWLVPGMEVSGGFLGYVWVSALFGIVNAIIGTLLRVLTLPLTVLTLGLFSVIVNAVLLKITDSLSDDLAIDEFWWTAIWAALVIAIVSVILSLALRLIWAPQANKTWAAANATEIVLTARYPKPLSVPGAAEAALLIEQPVTALFS